MYNKLLWGIYVLLALGIDASLIGLQCYTVFKVNYGMKVENFRFWIFIPGFKIYIKFHVSQGVTFFSIMLKHFFNQKRPFVCVLLRVNHNRGETFKGLLTCWDLTVSFAKSHNHTKLSHNQ